ncbi:hypothetical protein [Streptomyces hoynatensis]|uniref:DUF3558 domain-containing protein n=1 Tax=Streptomyces hoynatensis TaxID=1141874 RepID=A0A3A9ZCB7_9ACTN|nr:hypothetical protein [Streptomyces hoynatensis]RKN45759.1 hypothetical protein D7294_04680 [Streptomyces hoynatensis]
MNRSERSGALALALAALLLGCGGPSGREYALPRNFCGVDLPQEDFESLFPAGSKLLIQPSFDDSSAWAGSRYCRIAVDGDDVIRADANGVDSFEGAIVHSDLSVEMDEAEPVEGEFDAFVWPHVAMATAPCHLDSGAGFNTIETLTLALTADSPGDDDESVRVLSELIQPFMAATVEMTACQEGDRQS